MANTGSAQRFDHRRTGVCGYLDPPYGELIPLLMEHAVGGLYMQMASEQDPDAALAVVAEHLGTSREIAFAKIAARVKGTELAQQETCR